ncbi:hypothetical protein BDV18DRAFT_152048 [Aspergillus unguis]
MLDLIHEQLPKRPNDHNTYTLGSIGAHNIVLACLPKGEYGTNSAATAAAQMVASFPSIKVGLMVGIGGGLPSKVRLGDVVVSVPVDQYPGVVQWDMGKAESTAGGGFRRTGALNKPPRALLTALAKLETKHEMRGSMIRLYLDEVAERWPKLAPRYTNNSHLRDPHCDQISGEIRTHYGLIASGNQVVKDSRLRDSLDESLGGNVLCVEMEAAGLMNEFPCVVIRGICDYADSRKNNDWQEYAAAVAAAYAKELLGCVQSADVDSERPVQDILSDVFKTVQGTEAKLQTVRSKLERTEDLDILDWLVKTDYGPLQSDFLDRRQPGTGQWFLDSAEYQDWVNSNAHTLFCPGIPGAGKTILTATVIDDLTSRFVHDESIGIAYIYCNFNRQNEQSLLALLSSLLKQLCQGQPSVPESVRGLYDKHIPKRTRPSYQSIASALESVISKFLRVFIVVDALDECQLANDCPARLITELFNLQAACGLNIFATSRFIPQIAERFAGSTTLEIRANDQDVRSYLGSRISQSASKILLQHREEIQNEVANAVDGMFLLAQLHFDYVKTKRTSKKIREALRSLPKGSDAIEHAYTNAMQRIERSDSESRKLAKDILTWINCAVRPLSTSELRHALAVETSPEFDENNILSLHDIISMCAGLVTVDEQSDVFRLVHYTTEEYFRRTWTRWFPNAHQDIATTCVTYLLFDAFKDGSCSTDTEFEARLNLYPFYSYAARNWGYHAHEQPISEDLTMALFEDERRLKASVQGLFGSKNFPNHANYSQEIPTMVTGLHLAAYFELETAARYLIRRGHQPNAKDSFNRTPVTWAALSGSQAVLELLLEGNVDLNLPDEEGRTPLAWAACNGHESIVVSLLSKQGIDIESRDQHGRTPLSLAASCGCVGVLEALLQRGAYSDSMDIDNRTPLSWAAYRGRVAATRLLLACGVRQDSRDLDGQTPLSWAAYEGCDKTVALLLEGSVDPDSRDEMGRTPLTWAAIHGHDSVVQLLLNKGAQIQVDKTGQSPLHWAERSGHRSVAGLLGRMSRNSGQPLDKPVLANAVIAEPAECERSNSLPGYGSEPRSPSERRQQLRGVGFMDITTFASLADHKFSLLPQALSCPAPHEHLSQTPSSGKWQCLLCPLPKRPIFNSPGTFRRHFLTRHSIESLYRCREPSCNSPNTGPWTCARSDIFRLHCVHKHGTRPTQVYMQQIRETQPPPQYCAICHSHVRSWADWSKCILRHCLLPGRGESSDGSSVTQA